MKAENHPSLPPALAMEIAASMKSDKGANIDNPKRWTPPTEFDIVTSNRTLRVRKGQSGNPPRLTTKTANPAC